MFVTSYFYILFKKLLACNKILYFMYTFTRGVRSLYPEIFPRHAQRRTKTRSTIMLPITRIPSAKSPTRTVLTCSQKETVA